MLEVRFVSGRDVWFPIIELSYSAIETFAVDANLHLIYFVDSNSNELKELNIIKSTVTPLASVSVTTGAVLQKLDRIRDVSLTCRHRMESEKHFKHKLTNFDTPCSKLNERSDLYWISGTSRKVIMKGNWNRNAPLTIISGDNLVDPKSLRYDVTSHRIYWLDNSYIRSSMTDGSDIQRHVMASVATHISISKDYFGWIGGNSTYFARKTSVSYEVEIESGMINQSHITVFDSSLQQDRRSSCQILNGGCENICVPNQNSHKCECDFGLQLKEDGTCKSSIYSRNFILVSDTSHGRILQIDINTGNIVKLPTSIRDSRGITFDKLTTEIFYSEASTNTIMSTTVHGENTSLVYATGLAIAHRIAIDYSTGNIYFTAAVFLFWTENKMAISRSYMDGTSRMYIARNDTGWPTGLAIDFAANRLYWADGLKNTIEYSDLNGDNQGILIKDADAQLMSVIVHGQYLYYTAWNRQRITKMDKTTGVKITFMSNHPELGRLDSLVMYADDTVDVNAICSKKNGNCSTFCFPTPTGRTCGCEDSVNLESDQTTCQGVHRCNTSSQTVNVLDCHAFPGETCEFECKTGLMPAVYASVKCDLFGQWNPPLTHLCADQKKRF
ncbi:low-density lipoprotein receptor-related protein 4-like [Saccostrea echinata]|uniref:low-density lipoprotein receptor-related protein 4-like n=1 Tax=Saccostrea echinata TaxID=191078 RepID=UPI002A806616|nr:low-density lipoprotein receptor-related protein 4-like [Saccostrea echinata]